MQIAGDVGGTGAVPPTSKLETSLSRPLALSKTIYINFHINEASGETLEPPGPYFASKIGGLVFLDVVIRQFRSRRGSSSPSLPHCLYFG